MYKNSKFNLFLQRPDIKKNRNSNLVIFSLKILPKVNLLKPRGKQSFNIDSI